MVGNRPGLWKEERVRNATGDQENEENTPRWESWEQMRTPEQWKWLTELVFYPRRGPVRSSTEELGNPQTEGAEGSIPGTEIEEGMTERNKELIDMTKEPKLVVA